VSLQRLIAACGDGPLVIFFALPPAVTMKCCELLRHIELPDVTRLALEKPFAPTSPPRSATGHQPGTLLTGVVAPARPVTDWVRA